MGALKRGLNPRAHELGMYICGGRGKHSRMTPHELLTIADKHGLQGDALVRYSRLTAKVDNTAIQDGFQLYLHAFVVTTDGEWAVIQQGMNAATRTARRYHWHSRTLRSFTEEPHVAVVGESQGDILNLVHRDAVGAQQGIVGLLREDPGSIEKAARHLVMPRRHHVERSDINLQRLGAVLAVAHDARDSNLCRRAVNTGDGTARAPVAYSTPKLPPIPGESCHRFHGKAATCSTRTLPLIP